MKYSNVAAKGDLIKSFDFQPMPGRDDSFIIGEVLSKGEIVVDGRYMFDGYTVRVLTSKSGSEGFDEKREGSVMYVPFEMMIDFDDRVSLVITKDDFELICSEVPEAA